MRSGIAEVVSVLDVRSLMIFAFFGIVYPRKAMKKSLDLVNACRGVLM